MHDGNSGAIGFLKDADRLIEDLKKRLENPKPIICPNVKCGCGMCAPKAKSPDDFKLVAGEIANFDFR